MKKENNCSVRFPRRFVQGSVTVKIYRIRHANTKSGFVYSVAWHAGGIRRQKQFTLLKEAEEEARLRAEQLAAGRIDAAGYTTDDLEQLRAAKELCGDIPLLSALTEWKKAREQTQGHILDAAKAWAERNRPSFKRITVAEAVDLFLKAKRKAGVDTKAGYGKTLPGLRKEMGAQVLDAVSSRRLQQYLDQHGHPVTRNSHRKRIVTLWRWARRAGYLPRDVQTEAERTDRAREENPEVGVITAETFGALLRFIRAHHLHYLPQLVLAGFCGLRRSEVHGQKWEDVSLDRKFVRVTHAKRGTPARRLVPLPDCAIAWLAPVAQPGGEVSPGNTQALDRIRDIGRTNGFTLPPNCFRHSFISHRVAATGDVNKTSLEAGNSPDIIFRHYRELFSEAEGKAWFEVHPEAGERKTEAVANA